MGILSIVTLQLLQAQGGQSCSTTPPSTTCTITALNNGTEYTFTVTATNVNGTGPASLPSNAVIPATVPDSPTIGTATAGNASASVGFTPSQNDGGSAIISYEVTSSPGGITGVGTSSPVTVNGLTNGTSYTFTVKAINRVGSSLPSGSSNAVTPATVPDAPTIGTATAGNATATVTFIPPQNDGGSAITSYKVTSAPDGLTQSGASSPITLNNLVNGTTYTFTVQAINAVGASLPSAPSNAVTPATIPGAPTAVYATVGNTQSIVSWTAPSDGGATITQYTVVADGTGQSCTALNGATMCTVSNLTNGTSYTFTVTATNRVGTGPTSQPSNVVIPAILPMTMYAGTGNGNTFFSNDAGSTWSQQSSPNQNKVTSIFLSGGILYASASITMSESNLYVSADGGNNWYALSNTAFTSFLDSAFLSGTTLWVAFSNVIQYSEDGGNTWQSTAHVPFNLPINSLYANGINLYAGCGSLGGDFNYTYDMGNTSWNVSFPRGGPSNDPVFSIFVTEDNWYAGSSLGYFCITPVGGASWNCEIPDAGNSQVDSIFVSGSSIYIGTASGNVETQPQPPGVPWTVLSNPDGSSVSSLFVSALYAATEDGYVEVSMDGGSTWTVSSQPDNSPVNSVFVSGTALYAGTEDGNVEISMDLGKTWAATPQQPASPSSSPVLSVAVGGGAIYAGLEDGRVRFSNDNGQTWSSTPNPTLTNSSVNSVFLIPQTINNQVTAYVGTADGQVLYWVSGNPTWSSLGSPDTSAVKSVFVVGTTVYAGTQNGNVEVYSNNMWTPTTNKPDGANPVNGVSVIGNLIYVSTGGGFVKVSSDNGVTWTAASQPSQSGSAVNSIALGF